MGATALLSIPKNYKLFLPFLVRFQLFEEPHCAPSL